jgi:hypothetical protein
MAAVISPELRFASLQALSPRLDGQRAQRYV